MVVNVANMLKGGRWDRSIGRYWPLAAYGMAGSFIGTRLLIAVSPEPFRPLLAAMLVLYLNAERIGGGLGWVHRYPRAAVAFSDSLRACSGDGKRHAVGAIYRRWPRRFLAVLALTLMVQFIRY